jgi:hypothetical protein
MKMDIIYEMKNQSNGFGKARLNDEPKVENVKCRITSRAENEKI